jgi:ketosteroid isomerase-like protein
MPHPNESQTRDGYDAFAKGDLETVGGFLTDDVVWHVLGRSRLSGEYRGRDEVFGYFATLFQELAGTLSIELHDVMANDEHAVALTTIRAERNGRRIEQKGVDVYNMSDGLVTEAWSFTEDQEAIAALLE